MAGERHGHGMLCVNRPLGTPDCGTTVGSTVTCPYPTADNFIVSFKICHDFKLTQDINIILIKDTYIKDETVYVL